MSSYSWLLEHGGGLLLGTTALLAATACCVWSSRSPAARQAVAELGVGAALLWLVLSLLPLPRPLAPPAPQPAARETRLLPGRTAPVRLRRPAEPARTPPGLASAATPSAPQRVPAGRSDRRAGSLPGIDLRPVLLGTHLLGTFLSAAWLLLGLLRLRRLVQRSLPAPPEVGQLVAADLPRRPPRIRVAQESVRPFSFGLWRPVILVPRDLLARRDELEHVLRHECVHVERRDALRQLSFLLALPFLWFHPLYWWLRRRSHLACELIADEAAAARSDRPTYARHLIRLAERRLFPVPPIVSTALRAETEFYRRMKMLLDRTDRLPIRCSNTRRALQGAAAIAALVPLTCLFGNRAAVAQVIPPEAVAASRLQDEREALLAEVERLRQQLRIIEARLHPDAAPERLAGKRLVWVRVKPGDTWASLVRRQGGDADDVQAVRLFNERLSRKLQPQALVLVPARRPVPGHVPEIMAVSPEPPDRSRPGPGLPGSTEPGPLPRSVRAGAAAPTRTGSAVEPARPASPRARILGQDVLELVTRSIDLDAELRVAQSAYESLRNLEKAGTAGKDELLGAEIRLQTTQRKRALVLEMIRAEIEASEVELKQLLALRGRGMAGHGTRAAIVRLESRIRILKDSR